MLWPVVYKVHEALELVFICADIAAKTFWCDLILVFIKQEVYAIGKSELVAKRKAVVLVHVVLLESYFMSLLHFFS